MSLATRTSLSGFFIRDGRGVLLKFQEVCTVLYVIRYGIIGSLGYCTPTYSCTGRLSVVTSNFYYGTAGTYVFSCITKKSSEFLGFANELWSVSKSPPRTREKREADVLFPPIDTHCM
jgi:hypothetical protein